MTRVEEELIDKETKRGRRKKRRRRVERKDKYISVVSGQQSPVIDRQTVSIEDSPWAGSP